MKKILGLFICMTIVIGFAAISQAGTGANASAGATLTITDADADLTFNPSPNVWLGFNVDAAGSVFAINSQNDLTTDTNGMEYGIWSENTGYYQRQKTVDTGGALPAAPDPTGADPFTGWTAMGGGS